MARLISESNHTHSDKRASARPRPPSSKKWQFASNCYRIGDKSTANFTVETLRKDLPAWEDLIHMDSVECDGITFKSGDQVAVVVDGDANPSRAQILSIRKLCINKKEFVFLVVEWFYTRSQVRSFVSVPKSRTKPMLTNHLDVVFMTDVCKKLERISVDKVLDLLHKPPRIVPHTSELVSWLFPSSSPLTTTAKKKNLEVASDNPLRLGRNPIVIVSSTVALTLDGAYHQSKQPMISSHIFSILVSDRANEHSEPARLTLTNVDGSISATPGPAHLLLTSGVEGDASTASGDGVNIELQEQTVKAVELEGDGDSNLRFSKRRKRNTYGRKGKVSGDLIV